jgi:hypothetical protein
MISVISFSLVLPSWNIPTGQNPEEARGAGHAISEAKNLGPREKRADRDGNQSTLIIIIIPLVA